MISPWPPHGDGEAPHGDGEAPHGDGEKKKVVGFSRGFGSMRAWVLRGHPVSTRV